MTEDPDWTSAPTLQSPLCRPSTPACARNRASPLQPCTENSGHQTPPPGCQEHHHLLPPGITHFTQPFGVVSAGGVGGTYLSFFRPLPPLSLFLLLTTARRGAPPPPRLCSPGPGLSRPRPERENTGFMQVATTPTGHVEHF